MATNYSELKTEIADWTHRSNLTSFLDTFIDYTEARMNRKLRMSEMETSTSIAVTTANLTLPTDFLETREVNVSGSPDTTLEFLTPHQFSIKQNDETGKPKYYSIQGDAMKLMPYGSYTIELLYYKNITALDSTNTSNFILSDYPDMYLNGCLHFAYLYSRDADNAAMHAQEFERLMNEANKVSRARKFNGVPLRTTTA